MEHICHLFENQSQLSGYVVGLSPAIAFRQLWMRTPSHIASALERMNASAVELYTWTQIRVLADKRHSCKLYARHRPATYAIRAAALPKGSAQRCI